MAFKKTIMKSYAWLLAFILLPFTGQSQLGYSIFGKNPSYFDWEGKQLVNGDQKASFAPILGAYLDYEYQPSKEKNLLILTQLGYNKSISNIDYRNITMLTLGVGLKFFPFHFSGDCDCPRFYQDGTWFSRGFFLSAIPKVGRFSLDGVGSMQGLGELQLGIEIPMNKKTAISPFLSLEFGSPTNNQFILPSGTKSSLSSIGIGIRWGGM